MSEIVPFPKRGGRSRGGRQGCPICGKPQEEAYRPFCSRRCKQVDLGRWLGERYRLPSDEAPDSGAGGSGEEQA